MKVEFWGALITLIILACDEALGQIRITAPEELAKHFIQTFPPSGTIPGSTATFGAPYYGTTVIGRFVYNRSESTHCHKDYFEGYKFDDETKNLENTNTEISNTVIIVVDRGGCTFVNKVRVAQEYDAIAVVVVDTEKSNLDAEGIQHIVMADDGHGRGHAQIPSVLIDYRSGQKLKNAIAKADLKDVSDSHMVYGELNWEIPQGVVATVDFWTSAGSGEGNKFLLNYAHPAEVLKAYVSFVPHYWIVQFPPILKELCYDPLGKNRSTYCAEDPDGPAPGGTVTGAQVVEEDLRQLCLYNITAKSQGSYQKSAYSKEFWAYLKEFEDSCSVQASKAMKWLKDHISSSSGAATPMTRDCSERILKNIGFSYDTIKSCVEGELGDKLLYQEKNSQAWSILALRVNGQRFSGDLDPYQVTRAVCSSLQTNPDECKTLLEEATTKTGNNTKVIQGISMWTVTMMIISAAILFAAGFLFYRKKVEATMRHALRMEVMMEVRSQMHEYYKRLPEDEKY